MKSKTVLLGASLLGGGILFVYLGVHHIVKNPSSASNQNAETDVSATALTGKTFETRVDEQGEVAVDVTPIKIDPASGSEFKIGLNTHTVEIDADLTKVAYLYDDQSHYYPPVKWDGPQPGGHHRNGKLYFGPMDSSPKFVELKIKGVGGIAVRSFKWNLK